MRCWHIDVSPDQCDRPKRETADQGDPAGHRHGLRLRMAAGFCDVPRKPACDAEQSDHACDQDDEDDPGEDIESTHGAPPENGVQYASAWRCAWIRRSYSNQRTPLHADAHKSVLHDDQRWPDFSDRRWFGAIAMSQSSAASSR